MKFIAGSRMLFLGISVCLSMMAAEAQTKPEYVPNLNESIVPPPSTPMSRAEIEEGLKSHDRALLISTFWIRDPYIVSGPDGYYYLTGTIGPNDETRAKMQIQNRVSVYGEARIWSIGSTGARFFLRNRAMQRKRIRCGLRTALVRQPLGACTLPWAQLPFCTWSCRGDRAQRALDRADGCPCPWLKT